MTRWLGSRTTTGRPGRAVPRRIFREKYSKHRFVTDSEVAEWSRRAADRGYLTKAKGPGDRIPRQPTKKLLDWTEAHQPRMEKKR
jgi:hypothetical protein